MRHLVASILVSISIAAASIAAAQPQPPTKQARPRRPVAPQIANLELNIEQVGFRDETGVRVVYVKARVVRARGANPAASELVPPPPAQLGTLPQRGTVRDRPAFRTGDSVWFAYRCRLERGHSLGCGVGTNHPPGLLAVGRVSLQLLMAEVHPDEVPTRPVVPRTGPPETTPGPTFRLLVDGVVQRTVVQVVVADPGTLRTDTGPMVVP
jgi:hypothetical protein